MATTDRPDLDTIVVLSCTGGGEARRLHAPDDDGTPLCQTVTQADHNWVRKSSAVYPPGYRAFYELCWDRIQEGDDE